jgi:hypothetical protein
MGAEPKANAAAADPLCWICKKNKADSGEHKTKRSDLLAVLGTPTQEEPFFYHDLHKANRSVGSLDAKILKSPVRICAHCNNARTQPHDRTWESMCKVGPPSLKPHKAPPPGSIRRMPIDEIGGSAYLPLAMPQRLEEEMETIAQKDRKIEDPFE